jgi:hypothetical protein
MLKIFLVTISILILRVSTGYSQGNWELKRNENGIEVYTRKPLSGSLKELRVICELTATKTQLIKTLQDINNYKQWVYSTKSNYLLKTVNPQELIYHSISHLPWPLRDRDLIIELSIIPGSVNDKFEIKAVSLPTFLPVDNNFIRVPYSLALWKVTVVNEHKLKIDYTFSVDPGGSIPAWLVNSTLSIGPYNSFIKLKEELSRLN